MLQVVDSNGQLEESELQRTELAAQELLDIQPTEAGDLIKKRFIPAEDPGWFAALTVELKEMNLEARINFIKQLWNIAHADGRADKFEKAIFRR